MTLSINGVALVTGAGSGIGQECVRAYAAEGARGVVAADCNYEAALETARFSEAAATNVDFKALAIAVDVTDLASVESMVQQTLDIFGRIDYAVNSAGVGIRNPLPLTETDPAEMERFWRVNVLGIFHCMQVIGRVMKKQSVISVVGRNGKERSVGRGAILNLGSASSYVVTPNLVPYTTSKHAVIGMTKNAALDLAPHGVRVNAICPGWVKTPMVVEAVEADANLAVMMETAVPLSRIAETEEIADIIVFMTSCKCSYVTGSGWMVDGGSTLQLQAS